MDALTKKHHNMFVAAAAFNWVAGISFLKPIPMYEAMGITPIPDENSVLHILCLLIICFGFGYFKASKDFPGNASVIRLGMVAKALVVVVTAVDVALGVISWQVILAVSGDFIFSILFYKALQDLDTSSAKKK